MAKKKTTEDLDSIDIEQVEQAVENAVEQPAPVQVVEVDKYLELVTAAQQLLNKYKETHTVKSIEDFKYPGLEALAKALNKL